MDARFSKTIVEYFYTIGFAFLCIPVLGEIIYLTYERIKRCCCSCARRAEESEVEEKDQTYERLERSP